MSLYYLQNIHEIPDIVPDHGLYAGRSLEFDKPMALANAANEARKQHNERLPSNFLLSELTGYQGVNYARSLITYSTMTKTKQLIDGSLSPDAWLGVLSEKYSIVGAVLVQRSIKILLGDDVVIEEGTCVEGFVTDENNYGLAEMYRDGIVVADAISDGQPVFSIESAPREQSFFEIFKEGRFKFDDDLIKKMGTIYANRTDADNFTRSDMPGAAQVPKIIYSNSNI